MLVILIGLPGSGKSTQGQFLASKLNLPYLSTGDMLRKMAKSEETEGKLLKKYVDSGKFVPGYLVNKIVKKFLTVREYQMMSCVLDGYPRSIEQAKFLEKISNQYIKVIYLNIDDNIVIKRILGRFSCGTCEKNYNLYFDKPKLKNICDQCGESNFVHRKDDHENTIKERIETYKSETYQLIEYYKNKTNFYSVNASKNKKKVAFLLLSLLKKI